ncbi:SDR family oxidoreductase [Terriglobus saanensis]|uniref:Short-chain dehydrogenase/reductase SDR n=1 Tax=Terriglobus saanensis (strain ATCC BAA-1853 / DSM 23119 / SP1PR4) TaxID=401053 RepID=E8V6B5_TERSS|nr:SDR family oxidoreductase [Terriglobus saanensis]ADV81580.1 short-chain dehydrogenase/reductase SDR [Terriglobus saanensis SP1PR4]
MKLKGKRALITGGNSGIGLATAQLFIQEGAHVAITGRDQATLEEAESKLGARARAYRTDVSDSTARKEFFVQLQKDFGHLDIVFANAGIGGATLVGSSDEALFESVLRTNVTGAYFTVESAVPLLRDGASIIFNGSIAGSLGRPGYAAYAASKAGVRAMARCLAAELSSRNIRVNVVSPGVITTPIWDRSFTPEQIIQIEKRARELSPLGRVGHVDEVAKAVLFLASEDSSYVQAIEMFVDGGIMGTPYGGPGLR